MHFLKLRDWIHEDFEWEFLSHEINWISVSKNPAIFTYDYKKIKDLNQELHKELIEELFHPKRIQKYLDMGGELEDYLC